MGDAEYQHLQETHKTSDHYSREIALRVKFPSVSISHVFYTVFYMYGVLFEHDKVQILE